MTPLLPSESSGKPRILIVDDNPSVHEAFTRILRSDTPDQELESEEAILFGESEATTVKRLEYSVDHAMSGQEAVEKVRLAVEQKRPFQVAFVDVRMPGIDGVKTIELIWELDAQIQTVICTAYADYRWRDLAGRFGQTDRLLVLKKPFHDIEVMQLASTLTQKWALGKQAALKLGQMESLVAKRTQKLLDLQKQEHQRQRDLDQAKLRSLLQLAQEFRTPLTLILNPIADLMNGVPLDRAKQEVIHRSAQSVLRWLEDAALIRRLEAEEKPLELANLHLIPFLRGLVESFSARGHARGVQIEFAPVRTDITIATDVAALEKGLFSLLGWSVEAAPDNGRVLMRLRIESNHVAIEIAVAKPREIPSPLTKNSDTAQLLVREILHRLNATMEIKHSGEALKIDIGLGELQPHAAAAAVAPALEHAEEKEWPLLLTVEVSDDLRAFIREGLGAEYRFAETTRADEALTQARENVPDLIIIDFDAVPAHAVALCAQIKNDQLTSHIPVILIGADVSDATQLNALKAGVDDCLAKPFRLPLLKARVSNLLETRRKLHQHFQGPTPIQPADMAGNQVDAEFLRRVVDTVEANLADYEFDVETLGHRLGVSRRQLFRKFKAIAGCTPNVFIREIRLKRAARLLEESRLTISEIIYAVGFSDPKHFRTVFRERFGVLPGEYAKKPSS